VSVRHARHGNVFIALATAIAGVRDTHQARGKLVAQIAFQYAILDQDRSLGRLAFIVNVQRPPPPGHGAIVHHGALFAGYTFSDQAGESRGLLAVEVCFQTVPHSFVQQNTGPSWSEDHFHVAGRRFARVKLENCLTGGFFGEVLWCFLPEKEVESDTPSTARAATRRVPVGFSDAGDVKPRQWLRVLGKGSIGTHNQDVAQFISVAGANFLNSWVCRTSGGVGAHYQLNLCRNFGVNRRQGYRVQTACSRLLKSNHGLFRRAARDEGRRSGRVKNSSWREVVRVGIARALAGNNPDPATCRNAL